MTATAQPPPGCPRGVAPEDAAAWAMDGVAHDDIDLDAHVPVCPACMAVVTGLASSDRVADALREAAVPAPESLTRRAVGRIRLERDALLLARTVLGAAARVARAVPGYVAGGPGRAPSPPEGDDRV